MGPRWSATLDLRDDLFEDIDRSARHEAKNRPRLSKKPSEGSSAPATSSSIPAPPPHPPTKTQPPLPDIPKRYIADSNEVPDDDEHEVSAGWGEMDETSADWGEADELWFTEIKGRAGGLGKYLDDYLGFGTDEEEEDQDGKGEEEQGDEGTEEQPSEASAAAIALEKKRARNKHKRTKRAKKQRAEGKKKKKLSQELKTKPTLSKAGRQRAKFREYELV
ncbi:unnamed protein product [Tilletia laevis]|uniref:Uncharacterized protein n=2 Tax=Tilletia TaxID=13289 RepID=A0A177V3U9_9BASI|nr:hypothetical protein CF336_g1368 [Tilletia laevis]KAE8264344.1 hypothetical protein A4X03_0g1015 [Tilletia caries]KAE8207860.1 hypothetical protein CF335_g834 [Tilletia laevis]CAD6889863.1 unnamed protein product [Tilletia caries]CAD6940772.1 unnamed protein product [Tilletia laevis]